MGYIVFLCLLMPVIFAVWSLHRSEAAALRRQYETAREIIMQHATELSIRRRQKTIDRGYGLIDDSGWDKEAAFFVANVIVPRAGPMNSPPTRRNLVAIFQLIGEATEDFRSVTPGYSPGIDPVEYEHLIAGTLTRFGWTTRTTKGSGDQGVDVIAEMRGIKIVIQCKHYSHPVGNDAVQEAIAGKTFENAQYAAVVSNASFTAHAKQLAASANAILLHHDNLSELEQRIFGTASVARNSPRSEVLTPAPHYPLSQSHVGGALFGVVVAAIVAAVAASNGSTANSDATAPDQTSAAESVAPTPSYDPNATADSAVIAQTAPAVRQAKLSIAAADSTPSGGAGSPEATVSPAPMPLPPTIDDLTPVRSIDAAAADHIASYCATATAHAINHPEEILAGCRRNETNAWRRLTQSKEFAAIPANCSEPPFPDSYVAKEACARYELRR